MPVLEEHAHRCQAPSTWRKQGDHEPAPAAPSVAGPGTVPGTADRRFCDASTFSLHLISPAQVLESQVIRRCNHWLALPGCVLSSFSAGAMLPPACDASRRNTLRDVLLRRLP